MSAPALTLHRARAGAPFAAKGALESALGWWREDAGDEGEWLLVPRLAVTAPPPALSTPGAFARRLDRALAAVREAAVVDPAPGTWPRGALRFTRRERWLAWLAVRPAGHHEAAADGYAPLPEPPAAMRAQLRSLIASDPLVLPALTRSLGAAGQFADWVSGWSSADEAAIETALIRHFAVIPAALAALRQAQPIITMRDAPAQARPHDRVGSERTRAAALRRAREALAALEQRTRLVALEPRRAPLALLVASIAEAPAMTPWIADVLLRASPQAAAQITRPHREASSDRAMDCTFSEPSRADFPAWLTGPVMRPHAFRGDIERRPRPNRRGAAPRREARRAPETAAAWQHGVRSGLVFRPLAAAEASPDRVATRFGGLLFLINALISLGLYPDFTRPLDPRIAPSPSWLLARIGLAWFGKRFARDPLRAWLAKRAVGGDLPQLWRVDPLWGEAAQRLLHFGHDRHACTWDRRGFLAAVRPLRPRDRLLPSASPRAARALRGLPVDAEPWLAGLLSYLGWRLAAAGVSRRDLCLAAELVTGETEDDIILRTSLAELPIALRLAGLDRDPGWLPAEGCNMRFEFA